jgi:two-component system sensor histidine kinase KdpD
VPSLAHDSNLNEENLDAVRRRLLNVVGHELRTPMAALVGLSTRLAVASEEEIRSELAPAIERLATRTERLLDDLLVAAGISTALPVDRPEETDVAAVAARAWEQLGQVKGDRTFRTEGDAEAMVDPTSLDRVLNALLRNAIVYGEGEIVLATRRQPTPDGGPHEVVVTVTSGGATPSPQEIDLAFEPFFRGEHAVTSGPGLGLGLTVARALLHHAGGGIRLEPGATKGVVITFTLPAA